MQFGDPLAFQKGQAAWHRAVGPVWVGIENAMRYFEFFYQVWFISAIFVGLALIYLGLFLRIRASCLLWAAVVYALVVSSTSLEALPRFLSALFPFYLILGTAVARWPKLEPPLVWASCTLLTLSTILFVCGYWFT
jgi:hypothetical protein